MKKEKSILLIRWIKRLLGVITFLVWGYIVFTISRSPVPFEEQVPYCMGSTMLIFGILTGIFKGLEYWEKQIVGSE
jgi:peptidoglycan/LPS O-acetylase OafA/YrhL